MIPDPYQKDSEVEAEALSKLKTELVLFSLSFLS